MYAAGAGGNIVIGSGASGYYFLNVYAKSHPGERLGRIPNPQGIVNAASSSPFEGVYLARRIHSDLRIGHVHADRSSHYAAVPPPPWATSR